MLLLFAACVVRCWVRCLRICGCRRGSAVDGAGWRVPSRPAWAQVGTCCWRCVRSSPARPRSPPSAKLRGCSPCVLIVCARAVLPARWAGRALPSRFMGCVWLCPFAGPVCSTPGGCVRTFCVICCFPFWSSSCASSAAAAPCTGRSATRLTLSSPLSAAGCRGRVGWCRGWRCRVSIWRGGWVLLAGRGVGCWRWAGRAWWRGRPREGCTRTRLCGGGTARPRPPSSTSPQQTCPRLWSGPVTHAAAGQIGTSSWIARARCVPSSSNLKISYSPTYNIGKDIYQLVGTYSSRFMQNERPLLSRKISLVSSS